MSSPRISPTSGSGFPSEQSLAANKDLLAAAEKGDVAAVRRAIAAGADLNYQDQNSHLGYSALGLAIVYKRSQVRDLLLAAKVDPNLSDNMGITPLMAAAYEGDFKSVEHLLAFPDIDLFKLDWAGKSVFDYAKSSEVTRPLESKLASLPKGTTPERYLVLNFLGYGGGGQVDRQKIPKDACVDNVVALTSCVGAQTNSPS